jgi:hypothetical protein
LQFVTIVPPIQAGQLVAKGFAEEIIFADEVVAH